MNKSEWNEKRQDQLIALHHKVEQNHNCFTKYNQSLYTSCLQNLLWNLFFSPQIMLQYLDFIINHRFWIFFTKHEWGYLSQIAARIKRTSSHGCECLTPSCSPMGPWDSSWRTACCTKSLVFLQHSGFFAFGDLPAIASGYLLLLQIPPDLAGLGWR